MDEDLNTIEGTADADFLFGSWRDDLILAGPGNDLILARAGNDIVDAGEGNDAVFAGAGDDLVMTGLGSDFADGGRGIDTAQFDGDSTDYRITSFFGLTFVTDLRNGETDTLARFEFLKFDDGLFDIDGNPVASDPEAVDDVATTKEDTAVTIDVLGNDSDPNEDPLTVTEATAANGTVDINTDGTLQYTPPENFSGDDTITYTISDGNGGTSSATVAVRVNGVADTPVVSAPLSLETTDLAPIALSAIDASLVDLDGSESLSIQFDNLPQGAVISNPNTGVEETADANGRIVLAGSVSGFFLQLPAGATENFELQVEVTATELDPVASEAERTATSQFSIDVTVQESPSAQDDVAETKEDTSVQIPVISNDTDSDGDGLTVAATTDGTHGTAAIGPAGTVIYKPNADFSGEDSFTYTVVDPFGNSSTATVRVTVGGVADEPLLSVPDELTTIDRAAIDLSAIVADLVDIDGSESLIINLGGLPPGSTVTNEPGDIRRISGEAAEAAPTIITVGPDGTASIPDSTDGWILLLPSGTTENFEMTVDAVASEADPVLEDDDRTAIATATIPVNVIESLNPQNDVVTIAEDAFIIIRAADNDFGEQLQITGVEPPANGKVQVFDSESIAYQPDANFSGVDVFDYTVVDQFGETATATIRVNTLGTADTPILDAPESLQAIEFTPIDLSAILAELNDLDGSETLRITLRGLPPGAEASTDPTVGAPQTATADANGELSFSGPTAGWQLLLPDDTSEDFVMTIVATATEGGLVVSEDLRSASVEAEINIELVKAAQDDTATTNEDEAVTISVLDNDFGVKRSISEASDGANGTVTIDRDTLIYTPNDDFFGTDVFTYVRREEANFSTATVTVTVNPVNDLPEGAPMIDPNPEVGQTLRVDPRAITDVDGLPTFDTFTYQWEASTNDGATWSAIPGAVDDRFVPTADLAGAILRVVASYVDDGGTPESVPSESTAPVDGGNEDPIAVDDTATTREDRSVTINLLGNDDDPDSDPLTVESFTQPSRGSVDTLPFDSTRLVYTPESLFTGADTFTYTVSDGNGGTDTATVTVNVTPTPPPPFSVIASAVASAIFAASGSEPVSLTELPEGTLLLEDIDDQGDAAAAEIVRVGTPESDVFEFNKGDGNVLILDYQRFAPDEDVIQVSGFGLSFSVLDSDGDGVLSLLDDSVFVNFEQLAINFGDGDVLAVAGVAGLNEDDLLFV